eukprot:364793-Chlamydomonas_euryale.AAC.4
MCRPVCVQILGSDPASSSSRARPHARHRSESGQPPRVKRLSSYPPSLNARARTHVCRRCTHTCDNLEAVDGPCGMDEHPADLEPVGIDVVGPLDADVEDALEAGLRQGVGCEHLQGRWMGSGFLMRTSRARSRPGCSKVWGVNTCKAGGWGWAS